LSRYLFAAVFAFAFAAPAFAAPPSDVADVFPPGTLAYAELHNPAELGPHLSALVKGTPIEDSIPFIHGKKDQAKTLQEMQAKQRIAELALLVSPEVLAEFRKLGGIAVALVGFNDRGDPEVALAVLTGDSTAAGLAARMFVTTSSSLRKVAEVSKVPIFQYRQPRINYDPNTGQPKLDNDKPPPEGPYERTFAYTPGLFVVGSSKAAIAPIIKRFLGDEKDSLRGTDGFKTAAAEYRKPGIFFYVNAPDILAKVDAAGRARTEPIESDLLAWLRISANQKAVKLVAGCAQFRDGGVSVTMSAKLDPTQKSPLADFFAGPPVKVDALHHARKPASFAATMNLPDKNRATAVLGFLDAMAKSKGELGRLPSDVVKDLEANQKLQIRDRLLAKVRAITVIMPAKQELPKGAKAMPMLVLHLEDATAATAWEEFLPKLTAEIGGEKPSQPSSETVGGVKVYSLPATGLPWKSPVHFTRKDAVLVVGQDRKLVAGALIPDANTSVIGDQPLPLPTGDLAMVGVLNMGDLLGTIELPATKGPPQFFDPFPRERLGQMAPPDEMVKDADKARAAFLASFGQLPPAAVSVRRVGDELKWDIFQPKVQNGGLTPIINAGVTWYEKLMDMHHHNPNDYFPLGDK
jgi:hypothetical protein